jgi:uncharacterized membrane protein YedE/YeeE
MLSQRGQFCFSGAIKDILILKNTQRLRSIIIATISSILATSIIIFIYDINLTYTRYFININYLLIMIGGLMFGYGMMKSDGCGSRHLVKFAQGDKQSLYVLIIIGIFSYATYVLLSIFDNEILNNPIISLATSKSAYSISIYFLLIILFFILIKIINKPKDLLKNIDGILIGLLVASSWYITSIVAEDMFISMNPESLSFIYPVGKSIQYIINSFDSSFLIFPVMVMFGVLIGAFISSKILQSKNTKKVKKTNTKKLTIKEKLIVAVFVGVGGILSLGCTVGQGLSGLSSLSIASLLAITSIYISAYITAISMKKNNNLSTSFCP